MRDCRSATVRGQATGNSELCLSNQRRRRSNHLKNCIISNICNKLLLNENRLKHRWKRNMPRHLQYVMFTCESYHVSKVSQFRYAPSIDISCVQVHHEADVSYLRTYQIEQVSRDQLYRVSELPLVHVTETLLSVDEHGKTKLKI